MSQHSAVELRNKGDSSTFLVNAQNVKDFFVKDVDHEVDTLKLEDE